MIDILLKNMKPFIIFILLIYGFQNSTYSIDTPNLSTLGLYYTQAIEDKNHQIILEYWSDKLTPISQESPVLHLNLLQLKGWEIEWFIQDTSGRISALKPEETTIQIPTPFHLTANIRYTGKLPLSKAQLTACQPEVLLVPAKGISAENIAPTPSLFKRILGYKAPRRFKEKEIAPQNVLIILMDTLRPDYTPPYNHPFVIAPHIDMLAALGVRFANSYGTSSNTRPSCGSIFSGLYPLAHGAVRHATDGAALYNGVPLLAETFQKNSLQTSFISANAQVTSAFGFQKGFDFYECPVWESQVTPAGINQLQTLNEPFFMYLHYIAPHQPYQPPSLLGSIYKGQYQKDEQNLYCGEITSDDHRIGGILKELSKQGLLDRTLIWLLSDHGEEFWEHGWNGHGAKIYEETVKTVSIAFYPPLFQPGTIIEERVTQTDILPTLFSLYQWELPKYCQGQSLLPSLKGEPNPALQARTLYLHHGGGADNAPHSSDKEGIFTEKQKYILWTNTGEKELYDVSADPGEKNNLSGKEAGLQEQLHSQLLKHLEQCGAIAKEYNFTIENGKQRKLNTTEIENLQDLGYLKK